MNGNEKISALYSWPVIIIALIIFWPVGAILLTRRLMVDKKLTLIGGKLIGYLGYVLYFFAVSMLLAYFAESDSTYGSDNSASILIISILFAIGGFYLCKKAKAIAREAEDVKRYLSMIVNGRLRSLDSIAASTGKTYEAVRGDIQKMMRKGYLKNAYIDEFSRSIILPEAVMPAPASVPMGAAPVVTAPRVVACPCCGANNMIVGAIGVCEYCGSPLK